MAHLTHKFALCNDTAIRYIDSLKGDNPILFIHGYLECADVWEFCMQGLMKSFRVLAIDVPGHGISETRHEVHTMEYVADTIKDFLTQLNIDSCVVVGHSMGGYIAMAFAKKYPEMVSGIVMMHTTPKADSEEKKEARKREIKIIESNRKMLLAKSNPGITFAPENREEFSNVIEDLARGIMETDDDGIVALLKGMQEREDTSDILKNMKSPSMFIMGEKDEYIPMTYAKELEAEFTNSKFIWLENSGHMGYMEQEEDCIDAIEEFMKDVK